MADKLLIPCLYLQSGKAVTGLVRNLFGDEHRKSCGFY